MGSKGAEVMLVVGMTFMVSPSKTHWLFGGVITACSTSIVGPLTSPHTRITSKMVNNVGTRSAVCCLRYFDGIARHRRWRHKLREGRSLAHLTVTTSVDVTKDWYRCPAYSHLVLVIWAKQELKVV